jgi:hypothetical protein
MNWPNKEHLGKLCRRHYQIIAKQAYKITSPSRNILKITQVRSVENKARSIKVADNKNNFYTT